MLTGGVLAGSGASTKLCSGREAGIQVYANGPLVSAIIIFFDDEKFLSEAVESVLAQSIDHWELLLVDDGSSDASTRIAREYADRFEGRVRYLEHEGHQNKGMSAARNLGVRHAKGKYLAFLDSDDVWMPDKLQRQVSLLESMPEVVMTYGPAMIWHSWAADIPAQKQDSVQVLGIQPEKLYPGSKLMPIYLANEGVTPCNCGILVRADAVRRVNGFEASFRGMYEDQVFYLKMCLEGPVYVSSDCLSRYRRHSASTVSVFHGTDEYHRARLSFLEWLHAYLKGKKRWNIHLWSTLNFELMRYKHAWAYRALMFCNHYRGFIKRVVNKIGRSLRLTSWQSSFS
jgi:glycosyltransferase involved in cell wall biosynthesis